MAPEQWAEFSTLWMASNAIYRGDPDRAERGRAMSTIRRLVNAREARRLLAECRAAIQRIIAIPPGNLELDKSNPNFRRASQRCMSLYRDAQQPSPTRLAAVGGVLYQVRCNLIHGGKDPDVARDRMLVAESVRILQRLMPVLEAGAQTNASKKPSPRTP